MTAAQVDGMAGGIEGCGAPGSGSAHPRRRVPCASRHLCHGRGRAGRLARSARSARLRAVCFPSRPFVSRAISSGVPMLSSVIRSVGVPPWCPDQTCSSAWIGRIDAGDVVMSDRDLADFGPPGASVAGISRHSARLRRFGGFRSRGGSGEPFAACGLAARHPRAPRPAGRGTGHPKGEARARKWHETVCRRTDVVRSEAGGMHRSRGVMPRHKTALARGVEPPALRERAR